MLIINNIMYIYYLIYDVHTFVHYNDKNSYTYIYSLSIYTIGIPITIVIGIGIGIAIFTPRQIIDVFPLISHLIHINYTFNIGGCAILLDRDYNSMLIKKTIYSVYSFLYFLIMIFLFQLLYSHIVELCNYIHLF